MIDLREQLKNALTGQVCNELYVRLLDIERHVRFINENNLESNILLVIELRRKNRDLNKRLKVKVTVKQKPDKNKKQEVCFEEIKYGPEDLFLG